MGLKTSVFINFHISDTETLCIIFYNCILHTIILGIKLGLEYVLDPEKAKIRCIWKCHLTLRKDLSYSNYEQVPESVCGRTVINHFKYTSSALVLL
jgi:hypothetical protein